MRLRGIRTELESRFWGEFFDSLMAPRLIVTRIELRFWGGVFDGLLAPRLIGTRIVDTCWCCVNGCGGCGLDLIGWLLRDINGTVIIFDEAFAGLILGLNGSGKADFVTILLDFDMTFAAVVLVFNIIFVCDLLVPCRFEGDLV